MAEILRPSAVVLPSKQTKSKELLDHSLDELLERYLHLLNQYQTLQQSLSQLLASVRTDGARFRDSFLICLGLPITRPSQLFKSESCSLRPGSLR